VIDEPIVGLARRINAVDAPKAVVYLAGGGTEVFPMLLARGGGSSTLLSGRIPYDPAEFRALLGYEPGRFVDARAARGLAMAAFRHALTIRGDRTPGAVFGLGATSKLSRGEGERQGRSHEVHAAIQTSARTVVRSVTLPTGLGRAWEERINALVLLNLLALGKGVDASIPLEHDGRAVPASSSEERVAGLEDFGIGGLEGLMIGARRWTALDLDGGRIAPATPDPPRLLLPGSFRPIHEGHLAMAGAASRLTDLPCDFEISLFHPDKPPLDYVAIRSRLKGFGDRRARVYLTDAPTYLDKARLFPGCTFAVGHDTALRILDPRYYGGAGARDDALAELEALGTRFLIFGRVDDSGQFRDFEPADFDHPVAGFLGRSAQAVPETSFRVDVSSTQVRDRAGDDFA
jgi:hypothetical protein